MQKTIITGHIGKDAEVNEASNGNTVINFNVAVTENWKNKQGEKQSKTTWYRCSWWLNNTAIAPYLLKGTKVLVEGKPNANAYQNQQGETIVQEGINVNFLELLGGGGNSSQETKTTKQDLTPKEDDLPFGNEDGDLEF